MPRELAIDPARRHRSGRLEFPEILIHAYATPVQAEVENLGAGTLRAMLRHMRIQRGFEEMLATFKAHGAWEGISHSYKGPAHLSIGQEAAATGAAHALVPDDHIFGSHRSHGEFLAKGLAAIHLLGGAEALRIMRGFRSGQAVTVAERAFRAETDTALAEHALLFGLLAEIFMRSTGVNGGMGGSMHAFFPPFGAYPNNAIVGGSAGIAAGAALHAKLHAPGRITVAMAGDGATGCGPVWEAMNFAAQAQFDGLWGEKGGRLPVLFFFTNNFYAMGGQTSGETMGWDRLSRIGAGMHPEALLAETVDGQNPLAVRDAVARKRAALLAGRGPALLDVECYRQTGHSTTDANAYRTREEMAAWAAHDPIALFSDALQEVNVIDVASQEADAAQLAEMLRNVARAVIDPTFAPPVDIHAMPARIGGYMFSNRESPLPEGETTLLQDPAQNARLKQLEKRARKGLGEDGTPLSPMRCVTYRDGLFEAIFERMRHDPRLTAWGEECREWGGAFGVYRGLSELFPRDRLFNSPISEAAIVAAAVGYAMEGGRALVELMYGDFLGRAGDEVFNQLAKWQAMSAGELLLPVVLRLSIGNKYGAQHSQDWSAMVAHVPGLKVAYPATPHDAKGLMTTALASEDPVVMLESQRLYDIGEWFAPQGVPLGHFALPFGEPQTRRSGRDVTILTLGPSLYPALRAADDLAQQGVEAEVIDACTLVPFGYAAVVSSIERTGRLLVVTEACERGSFAMTLAANLGRFGHSHLRAAPRVLGSPNWIVPGADMEDTYFPQPADIVDAVLIDLMKREGANRRGLRGWDDIELARLGL
jgi:2-oxoisovalerate dehydrogenase E1 component